MFSLLAITIHIFPIIEWLTITVASFYFIKKIVDYLYMAAHPNYKWHQKGNICYEERDIFSGITAAIGEPY